MNVTRSVSVPSITEDDLRAFHARHFPGTALPQQFFIGYQTEEGANGDEVDDDEDGGGEEDSDGLGYYPDGVKRTLTDAQIAIFRHSELQRILWLEAGEYAGPIFPTRLGSMPQGRVQSERSQQAAKGAASKAAALAGNVLSAGPPVGRSEESTDDSPVASTPSAGAAAATSKKKNKKPKKKPKKATAGRVERLGPHADAKGPAQCETEPKRRRLSSSEEETLAAHDGAKKARLGGPARATLSFDKRHDPNDFREDGELFTYRRLARDEDDAPNVSVDLDY
ncbi:uncharacterized protein PV09_01754 [Verruconis gallopava]|uniref:Uncharacterized protein n=1 Tax=Verruconis gallopava TaxID=253628 RepID=A0A0D1XYF3_9PEZI|nr:uncharacterized protein PV09_01754 [Verruconis gallopava]KIW07836.1 hypothetical protein PV09_01754 [Verruconis gallopava]